MAPCQYRHQMVRGAIRWGRSARVNSESATQRFSTGTEFFKVDESIGC